MKQLIYKFSSQLCEGSKNMISTLGAKGAHLANMCSLGLPVPPGFTISNQVDSKELNKILLQLQDNIQWLEQITGKKFGGTNSDQTPLLLSIRSGATVSMPGMMDTVLNLGLNDATCKQLAQITNNKKYALDSYRRFIAMFSSVVLNISMHQFESELTSLKFQNRITHDSELTEEMLEELIVIYKNLVVECTNSPFPSDVWIQLELSILAVLNSWNNERAIAYRNACNISHLNGTAVNVQSMVFGNLNNNSATGIIFSRNTASGQNSVYGEYLINAQGEDIVSGIRTPISVTDCANSMERKFPELFTELTEHAKFLEHHYKDVQDIEFTIEDGKLYILQTRTAKRTVNSAVKIAYEMANCGFISKEEAILRVPAESINTLFYETIDTSQELPILVTGLPASPGAVSAAAVFSSADAELMGKDTPVILIRDETNPDDIAGIIASRGVLTSKGGVTSHAAVVARGMGKPCITGASSIEVNEKLNYCSVICEDNNSIIIRKGDTITIDGSTGKVILGEAPKMKHQVVEEFYHLLEWAKNVKQIEVKSNAENLSDIANAIKFGAQGIGLCRTEHMFLEKERLKTMRMLILANNNRKYEARKEELLNEIFNIQKKDFISIFEKLNGLSISIRLLDPPLHEFLPKNKKEIVSLAESLSCTPEELQQLVDNLFETNPMLGNRGVRLGMSNPEIFNAQIDAIAAAAIAVSSSNNIRAEIKANVEIMLPLVSEVGELLPFIERIRLCFKDCPKNVRYKIGTMIELPKAAIIANQFASHVDFFSYGTNDLTQTTLGLSRDDTARLINQYIELGIYKKDPFVTIDEESVGYLLELANKKGKAANPNLSIGVCGEHGGDHKSILYFASIGCNYVSCSPFRVMGAMFSAAQAEIIMQRNASLRYTAKACDSVL